MRLLFLYLWLWIVISLCEALQIVLVSEFSVENLEEYDGLLKLFRSIRLSTESQFSNAPIVVCYNGQLVDTMINALVDVELVKGHSLSESLDSEWRALSCALHVADFLFSKGHYDTDVVFIGPSFVVHSEHIEEELASFTPESSFRCYPRVMRRADTKGACELDYFRLKSSLGTPLRNVIRTMNHLQLTANEALELGLSRLEYSLSFFSSDTILRVLSYVNGQSETRSSSYPLIEIDGVNHKILMNQDSCIMSLFVEWPEFGTVPILVEGLQSIIESEEKQRQFVGCSPMPSSGTVKLQDLPVLQGTPTVTHRVFDCILFFDEISLLLMRLDLLQDVVDLHIIVEAPKTFTGKPKPLYFRDNEELFAAYRHKILVVTLEDLPTPSAVGDVWKNEYESRNALVEGLLAVQASDDDVILVADTDELIDPEAIRTVLSVLRYNDYVRAAKVASLIVKGGAATEASSEASSISLLPEYYKLFQHQYLYNFNCSLDDPIAKESRSSITTVRESKRISHLHSGSRDESSFYRPHPYYLIDARNHMSNAPVFPLNQLLSPGGVHLSFFESVERIKRKLESYSHQNFASQFHAADVRESGGGSAARPHDLANKDSLPAGEVSVNALMSTIQQGEVINFKNRKQNMKCIARPIADEFVRLAKEKWDAMAKEEDIV